MKQSLKVALLTSTFPYPGGEEFLETEINYWGKSGAEVIVFPLRASGPPRAVPASVCVDLTLSEAWKDRSAFRAGSALFHPLFWREILTLARSRRLTLARAFAAARKSAQVLLLNNALQSAAWRYGGFDLSYAYWNDAQAYAAVLGRQRGNSRRAVCRAHRYDVYEETAKDGYLPLKRQFINKADRVYAVSESGLRYMIGKFGLSPEHAVVSRLGVVIPDGSSSPSDPNSISIISVSSCTPVKRIDRIIHTIAAAAEASPTTRLTWLHIGGGELLESLEEEASLVFKGIANASYSFTGPVPHDEVIGILQAGAFDVAINLSESEGLPVSLMEAMSCGIPALATDVGGVAELVSPPIGALVSPEDSTFNIGKTLLEFSQHAKNPDVRHTAKEFVAAEFNSDLNYSNFVTSALSLESYPQT